MPCYSNCLFSVLVHIIKVQEKEKNKRKLLSIDSITQLALNGKLNVGDTSCDSGVLGNLRRIPFASFYYTYICIDFKHKYLFQMEKQALLYELI